MKKFEGLLICTDLDGTLLRNDKSISKENLEAIEYFKSEGGYFTIVTGRMPCTVTDIYNAVKPNAPFGCINGGGLYDGEGGKYIWTQSLSRDALELAEYLDSHIEGLGIQLNTFDKIYFARDNKAMELFRLVTGAPHLKTDFGDFDLPLAKIVLGDTSEERLDLVASLLNGHPRAGEFDFTRSAPILHEILPKGTNKGRVLPILADHLGIDMSKTVAIGDYNNDVEMLRTAHVGVAVANAVEEAKAAADYITVSNEENAIARVIYDIEEGKLKI